MRLLLVHGPLFLVLGLTLLMLAGAAWIRRRVRRAALAEAATIDAGVAAEEAMIAGQRVTLRGRLRVIASATRRLADGGAAAAVSVHGDADRRAAGRADRLWFNRRADALALEVTPAAGAAPLQIDLAGPIHVLRGSAEFRAQSRLRRLGRLRARILEARPEEGPQMDLDHLVERSLAAGDRVAITGTLRREHAVDGEVWTLGGAIGGAPFRRSDEDPEGALVAVHEGPPRRITSDLRGLLGLPIALAVAALFGLHVMAPRVLPSLQRERFDPRVVARLTPELTLRTAIAGLSPLHRQQALFDLARATEHQEDADERDRAEATALYELAGGCSLAVATMAIHDPEGAAIWAVACPGARGAAYAHYALGRFDAAAEVLAAGAGGRGAIDDEARWEVEALLLGRREALAAARLRALAGIDARSALADALADPEAAAARVRDLVAAPERARARTREALELADAAPDGVRFALLQALTLADLRSDEEVIAWWFLRAEQRPEVAWKASVRLHPKIEYSPRYLQGALLLEEAAAGEVRRDRNGEPWIDPLLTTPPLMVSDPMAHLDAVQPLPDYPWGLVFAIARDLAGRDLASAEARATRARVSHLAGVFEFLAGEYDEARRWLTIVGDECKGGAYEYAADLTIVCRDLDLLQGVVALFAGDHGAVDRYIFGYGASARPLRQVLARLRGAGEVAGDRVWLAVALERGVLALADLEVSGRLEHPALRLAGERAAGDGTILRYFRRARAPGACIRAASYSLLPELVARAETLDALGDADEAAALRARARRIRARLQEREGALALWFARGRSECVNNPVAPRAWDPVRALIGELAG